MGTSRGFGQLHEQFLGIGGRAAVRSEGYHLEHSHPAIERDRQYVPEFHRAAGRIDTRSVEAHMTRNRKRNRRAAGAHNARVPQPPVYTLAILVQA